MDELNQLSEKAFVDLLGEVFEHSPWVAKKAEEYRPYPSLTALHTRMVEVVRDLPKDEKLELIRAHPNLGEKIEMSDHSNQEQQGAGLKHLTIAEFQAFQALNRSYMEKFHFPFIFAVKGKHKDEIYQAMQERVKRPEQEEFETALSEIYKIAWFRLQEKIDA